MCNIYYPFFYIEKTDYRKKYNHKLYIYVLSLFCNKILIPARHLLEMKNDRMDILLNNSELFRNDIIFSRIPEDDENLLEYYKKVKEDVKDKTPELLDRRITKIVEDLYFNKEFAQYSPLDQQDYYSSKMNEFIKEYSKKHKNAKGLKQIEQIWKDKFVVKEVFDSRLDCLKENKAITKETYTKIRNASDLLYFLAGSSAEDITVCFDDFFIHQGIQEEIKMVVVNFDEKINQRYSPEYLMELLKKVGVIETKEDIEKLNIDDILYLREQPCFKEFVTKYEEYSSRREFEKIIEKKKNHFTVICSIKASIVSIALAVVGAILSAVITSKLWMSILYSIVILIVTYIITYLWQTKNKYVIPFVEEELDRIVGYIDPIALYFAKIKWRLSSRD